MGADETCWISQNEFESNFDYINDEAATGIIFGLVVGHLCIWALWPAREPVVSIVLNEGRRVEAAGSSSSDPTGSEFPVLAAP